MINGKKEWEAMEFLKEIKISGATGLAGC